MAGLRTFVPEAEDPLSRMLLGAHQFPDRAEFAAGRRSSVRFDGVVEMEDPLADLRERCPASTTATDFGGNRGLHEGIIEFLDQQPSSAVRHAERARRARNRSGRTDRLQQCDLARPDAVPAGEVDADGKMGAGHDASLCQKQKSVG